MKPMRYGMILSLVLISNSIAYAQTPALTQADDAPSITEPIGEEAYWALVQFLDYDKGQPLNVRVVEKLNKKTYTREKIVFSGVRGDRVPGYFAYPTSAIGPYPVVLFLHGFTNSKEGRWQDDDFESGGLVTKGLLEKGFATLSLDAQFHGERIAANDYEPQGNIFANGQYNKYREILTQTVVEYRMALDYLAMRAEVDTSRTGVIGYSMGGDLTFMLTAVEPRIKAAVACVASPQAETSMLALFKGLTADQFRTLAVTPQTRASVWAIQNYARAIGSQPFLMLNGRRDKWYTESEARQLYELIPSSTKELKFYDSGHKLPTEYVPKAVQWFEDHLK